MNNHSHTAQRRRGILLIVTTIFTTGLLLSSPIQISAKSKLLTNKDCQGLGYPNSKYYGGGWQYDPSTVSCITPFFKTCAGQVRSYPGGYVLYLLKNNGATKTIYRSASSLSKIQQASKEKNWENTLNNCGKK